jgi:hypothetical protein
MLQRAVFLSWLLVLGFLAVLASRHRDRGVRYAAALCSANGVLTIGLAQLLPHWSGVHPQLFVLDAVTAAAFVLLALKESSAWCASAAGFQVAAVALHCAYGIKRGLFAGAYYTGFVALGFLVAASIIWGVFFGGDCERRVTQDRP